MNIRTIRAFLIFYAILLLPFSGCSGSGSDVLSAAEIAALRDRYPIHEPGTDRQLSMESLIQGTSAYAVVRILGREADTSLPEKAPDDYAGYLQPYVERANFRIEILDAVVTGDEVMGSPILEGWQVRDGQELVVSFNNRFTVPRLEAGMTVALLVVAPCGLDGYPGYHSSVDGLYYVVDGHVVAGCPEQPDAMYSGQPLKRFKAEIVRLRESGGT